MIYVFIAMCPKGDDPWTTEQNNREIGLVITSTNNSNPLDGLLGIKLYGVTTFISLTEASDTSCQEGLQNSSQIGTVECNYTVVSAFEHHITVVFTSWPIYNIPDNNIFISSGNPDITDFYCDVSQASVPESQHNSTFICNFYDIQTANIKGMLCC